MDISKQINIELNIRNIVINGCGYDSVWGVGPLISSFDTIRIESLLYI